VTARTSSGVRSATGASAGIKTQVKSFLKAVQEQDVKTAEAEYRKTCGILDKVACTSSIHRNTAARRKSRLAKRLNALKAATA
jgi:small subunit ribosomal protein S20